MPRNIKKKIHGISTVILLNCERKWDKNRKYFVVNKKTVSWKCETFYICFTVLIIVYCCATWIVPYNDLTWFRLPEIVVQLKVGGRTCCLIHGSYNVRALWIFCIQEAIKHFSKRSCMMEVVQYDHRGEVRCIILTLFCYVGKILAQFFTAFMVHAKT